MCNICPKAINTKYKIESINPNNGQKREKKTNRNRKNKKMKDLYVTEATYSHI